MSTLRSRAIKLAHANPALRPHLLKAIEAADKAAGCEKLPNEKMQQLCEEKKKGGDKDKGDDKGDKKASLRSATIQLAVDHPALRSRLLTILAGDDGDKEADDVEASMSPAQFDKWLGDQPQKVQDDWKSNTEKYKDKFKGAAHTLFMTAASNHYAGCEKLPNEKMQQLCEDKKKGGDKDKDDKEASLRSAAIRLAHSDPALRPHLLPLLAQ